MPIFLMLFAGALVSVMLNVFPLTAIILWFMGGPWWPGLLVTLGFIAMGVEAWTGSISRGFLLGPILWLCCGAAIHLDALQHVHRIEREMLATNAAALPPGRPPREITIVQNKREAVSAESFIEGYDLDAVYVEGDGPRPLQYSIVRTDDQPLQGSGKFGVDRVDYFGLTDESRSWRGNLLVGAELKRQEVFVPPRETTVRFLRKTTYRDNGISGEMREYAVDRLGDTTIVKAGAVTIPGWLLFPAFGCGPSGSHWKCQGEWSIGQRHSLGTENGDAVAIARALGLKLMTVRERFPGVRTWMENARERLSRQRAAHPVA